MRSVRCAGYAEWAMWRRDAIGARWRQFAEAAMRPPLSAPCGPASMSSSGSPRKTSRTERCHQPVTLGTFAARGRRKPKLRGHHDDDLTAQQRHAADRLRRPLMPSVIENKEKTMQ
jgi:hypothetical protein